MRPARALAGRGAPQPAGGGASADQGGRGKRGGRTRGRAHLPQGATPAEGHVGGEPGAGGGIQLDGDVGDEVIGDLLAEEVVHEELLAGLPRRVADSADTASGQQAALAQRRLITGPIYPDAVWSANGDTELERIEGFFAHRVGMAHKLPTANAAVSWSTPTDTHPALAAMSYTP